jgi:hypothetical protein
VDWNSDGTPDLVSGERHGYFNVFVRHDTLMTGFRHYRLLDSTEIDVGMSSEPAVVDWNGDGRKDLLLSEEAGTIRFYDNRTSDTWPMFQNFVELKDLNGRIEEFRPSPYVFDLDRDGIQDLLIGTADGEVLFYDNIGTNARPMLAVPETVRTVEGVPAEPTPPAMGAARCGFGYWNGDSIPDFLIGCGAGTVELFLGVLPVGVTESELQPSVRIRVRPSAGRPPFRITVARAGRLVVTDALGRVVRTLGEATAGETVTWDGLDEASRPARPGVYFCGDDRRPAERFIVTPRRR